MESDHAEAARLGTKRIGRLGVAPDFLPRAGPSAPKELASGGGEPSTGPTGEGDISEYIGFTDVSTSHVMEIGESCLRKEICGLLRAATFLASEDDTTIALHPLGYRLDEFWIHPETNASLAADHHGNVERIGDVSLDVFFGHPHIDIDVTPIRVQ